MQRSLTVFRVKCSSNNEYYSLVIFFLNFHIKIILEHNCRAAQARRSVTQPSGGEGEGREGFLIKCCNGHQGRSLSRTALHQDSSRINQMMRSAPV